MPRMAIDVATPNPITTRSVAIEYGRKILPAFDGDVINDDLWLLCRLVRDGGRVVYEPVKITEWRNWDFLSPWEGTQYVLPGDEKTKGQG